jgi:hypothetical protein
VGYWGVKSYENDLAHDALDAAFEQVHGAAYDELMDDRNTLSFEQVQAKLADDQTLAAAVRQLVAEFSDSLDDWDDEQRLAYVGVVVRHAELKVSVPASVAQRAIDWLTSEDLEWEEATLRGLRKQKEMQILRRLLDPSLRR